MCMEHLLGVVHYNKTTGIMTWAKSRIKGRDEVGYKKTTGYRAFEYMGKEYLVHRVAFYMQNDRVPEYIDHINHIRDDNRMCNIREVTHRANMMNAKKREVNTSGTVGVHYRKDSKKWRAIITVGGAKVSLGTFVDKADAIQARMEANIRYGFHENHGR